VVPLTCTAEKGHDCLPTEATCNILKPETDIAPIYQVDAAKKEIRSPFRTALLKAVHTTLNKDSLVLQGVDLTAAWSLCRVRPVQGRRREITRRIADTDYF
jgi:hypothetical protein